MLLLQTHNFSSMRASECLSREDCCLFMDCQKICHFMENFSPDLALVQVKWFLSIGLLYPSSFTTLVPSNETVAQPDSLKYCLRASCIKKRKQLGDVEKVELSDVWSDVHRIKHKRDRDAHPCQLPERLMERLSKLSTPPDGLVFDPFCGAGTTAIASLKAGRQFVTVDLDKQYVEITNRKIKAMQEHADLFGHFFVPREKTQRIKKPVSKKGVETYLQELARRLGKVPTEENIREDRPEILSNIDLIYPNRLEAIKRCRVVL
jgi:hypothetical protein